MDIVVATSVSAVPVIFASSEMCMVTTIDVVPRFGRSLFAGRTFGAGEGAGGAGEVGGGPSSGPSPASSSDPSLPNPAAIAASTASWRR